MISVCYTSARPAVVPARVQEWLARAADPEAIEFVVTIDAGHAVHQEAFARLPRTRAFLNHGRPCCVDGWNLAARKARGSILIQCSDDLHPPERWDAVIRARLADGARPAVLAISDGYTARPQFIPHAIVTRPYYRQLGYLFHEAYWSMWSDNELSAVAYRRAAVVDAYDIWFAHSHGQVNDDVRARHEMPHLAEGQRTFDFRQQHGFEPWMFDAFAGEDGDSDGIYSPHWRVRLAAYWEAPPRTAADVLALHRDSHERRTQRWGPQPAVAGLEVLICASPERRELRDLLTTELARQGIPFLVDDGPGDEGERRTRLHARATGPYVTFMDDDVWVSHDYGELVGDAIANDAGGLDAILHDVVVADGGGKPRPTHFSFDREAADVADCRLRAPDHSMVWKREIAMSRQAATWGRIRGLIRFHETARPGAQ